MVFPHNKFPSYENSSLHISAMEESSNLKCFKKDLDLKPGMKRPACRDSTGYNSTTEKRKRIDPPFFTKEEVSEADFQMKVIKQSLERKKDWVYRQVLQKFGVDSSPGNCVMKRTQREAIKGDYNEADLVNNSKTELNGLQRHGMPLTCYKSRDGNKVHDEEGNCYIDEDDFKSFSRLKGNYQDRYFKGQYETTVIDNSDLRFTPKRNLNFTFHGSNGGVAIDHGSLPKVIGIHSVPRKAPRPGKDPRRQQHIGATIEGSTYKTTNQVKEDHKWWPPSPESIPGDVMSNDGEGLLKVMTPDDMKAYGLPKQENLETSMKLERSQDEDDVIVTRVKRGVDNSLPMEKIQEKADLHHDMPALQLDAHGKPANYKEILLHYITKQLKHNPQNPSLQKITDDAVAGRPRKTLGMDELCKKLLNTRERLGKEQMKWKRKLLSSLEVVLVKKMRTLEHETGEQVPEGIDLQGPVTLQDGQCGGNASQNDIVAVMEDLTAESGDVKTARCQKITERSVSSIRGYDSC